MSLAAAYIFGRKQGVDLFLDAFTGSSGAWSLRKLKSTSNKVIRVRRTSDNTQNDFSELEINDGTLVSFCGVGSGRVSIIYDQIGSNNFTNTVSNRQGEIVTNGILNTLNGKPIILRKDGNTGYTSTFAPNNGVTVKNILYVGNLSIYNTAVLFGSSNGINDIFLAASTDTTSNVNNNVTVTNQRKNSSSFTPTTRQQVLNETANQFLLSSNIDFNFEFNLLSLGYRFQSPFNFGMFHFQELVIFENTTDISGKETAINNNYSIY
tara:strand:+ start:23 stop:817 length:795 start_codon:yes stop_codon:yes gene_type:complete